MKNSIEKFQNGKNPATRSPKNAQSHKTLYYPERAVLTRAVLTRAVPHDATKPKKRAVLNRAVLTKR